MNSIHEMLFPDLIDLKIAGRRAEALAWRQAHEATEARPAERSWSLSGVLRLPSLGHSGHANEGHLTLSVTVSRSGRTSVPAGLPCTANLGERRMIESMAAGS